MFCAIAKRSSRYIGVTSKSSLFLVALAPSPSLIAFCDGKGEGTSEILNHIMAGRIDKATEAVKKQGLEAVGGAISTGVPTQLSWGFFAGFASGEYGVGEGKFCGGGGGGSGAVERAWEDRGDGCGNIAKNIGTVEGAGRL